jgi:hypothetical protein
MGSCVHPHLVKARYELCQCSRSSGAASRDSYRAARRPMSGRSVTGSSPPTHAPPQSLRTHRRTPLPYVVPNCRSRSCRQSAQRSQKPDRVLSQGKRCRTDRTVAARSNRDRLDLSQTAPAAERSGHRRPDKLVNWGPASELRAEGASQAVSEIRPRLTTQCSIGATLPRGCSESPYASAERLVRPQPIPPPPLCELRLWGMMLTGPNDHENSRKDARSQYDSLEADATLSDTVAS